VNTDDVGARLAGRFGPDVVGWLAAGGFVPGELFESGASSVVMRCQWPDGTPAVLKFSPDKALLTPMVAIAYLTYGGPEPAIDELLTLT
jgi:streptomycin 6-kinase